MGVQKLLAFSPSALTSPSQLAFMTIIPLLISAPFYRSYLAELLLEKGYIVHGISRGVRPGSNFLQMQAAWAEGELLHSS